VTEVRAGLVDLYPLRQGPAGLEALVLRRGPHGRCPGSWEAVHGHVEPDDASPAAAALRELAEETGLPVERLYNLSRVEAFWVQASGAVQLVPAFAAFVAPGAPVRLSPEHDAAEWLPLEAARARCTWPRSARALEDAGRLLATGDAGVVEDVLRVR
jgi:8-oxo-dGTP pyrophosphatase MutT (NUDIX family)